jgi:hypothetical protein
LVFVVSSFDDFFAAGCFEDGFLLVVRIFFFAAVVVVVALNVADAGFFFLATVLLPAPEVKAALRCFFCCDKCFFKSFRGIEESDDATETASSLGDLPSVLPLA